MPVKSGLPLASQQNDEEDGDANNGTVFGNGPIGRVACCYEEITTPWNEVRVQCLLALRAKSSNQAKLGGATALATSVSTYRVTSACTEVDLVTMTTNLDQALKCKRDLILSLANGRADARASGSDQG